MSNLSRRLAALEQLVSEAPGPITLAEWERIHGEAAALPWLEMVHHVCRRYSELGMPADQLGRVRQRLSALSAESPAKELSPPSQRTT